MPHWEKRRVGRTALEVTTLGLGTATMGGSRVKVTQQEGDAIVRAAWSAGVRYVDTAPFYGVGAAERRVGDALREQDRDQQHPGGQCPGCQHCDGHDPGRPGRRQGKRRWQRHRGDLQQPDEHRRKRSRQPLCHR